MSHRYHIVSYISVLFIVGYLFFTYNLPISERLYLSKDINIVFFTPQPFIVNLAHDKTILIKEIVSGEKRVRSIVDLTSEILSYSGVERKDSLYIKTSYEEFRRFIKELESWQEKPINLFRVAKRFFSFETNISVADRINLFGSIVKSRGLLYVKLSMSDKNYSLESKDLIPTASLIFHSSKAKIIGKISKRIREKGIDIVEEKKNTKKAVKTSISIKSEQGLDLAKSIISTLNQKQEIPIKIEPAILYDLEIYIGDDFKEDRWR